MYSTRCTLPMSSEDPLPAVTRAVRRPDFIGTTVRRVEDSSTDALPGLVAEYAWAFRSFKEAVEAAQKLEALPGAKASVWERVA